MTNRTALFSRHQPGGVFTIEDVVEHPGAIFFVHSGTGVDAAGGGRSPDAPLATVDYAIGLCTANKGDVIYVLPGHTESTTAANAELFDLDVAGVSIIGLGLGNKRPTFTLGVASATIVMGAAGCRLSNIRLIGDVSDLVTGLEIEAAATDCMVDHCYFADTATNKDMLVAVLVAADADRLTFVDNHIDQIIGGEATEGVKFAGGCDGLIFARNYIYGDYKTNGAVDLSAAASLRVFIHNNLIINAGADTGLCIKCHASLTGAIAWNHVGSVKNNTETIVAAGAHAAENYGNDTAGTTGILTPATPTAWS